MTLLPLADSARLLGIHPKTLCHWRVSGPYRFGLSSSGWPYQRGDGARSATGC